MHVVLHVIGGTKNGQDKNRDISMLVFFIGLVLFSEITCLLNNISVAVPAGRPRGHPVNPHSQILQMCALRLS